jgi:hypothetical protein
MKRPKLFITLGALVCVAAAAFALVQWLRSEWEARQIHRFHGGAIVRSFFNAGFEEYVVDHGDIPDAWKKLTYFPNTMDEQFGDPVDSFWRDISYLPGAKKTSDGIENFRVWFLDKAEMAKTNGFFYQSPFVPKDTTASLDWPTAWVVYKDHGRTMVAVVSEDGNLMTADEFIPFLQHAMAYAKAHGIPYDPSQIDYIKNF